MTSISPAVLSVLELFQGPLAGMRFADVDAEGLAVLASNVEAAGAEVAAAESKLGELRQALVVQQDALLVLAQRALAYARVYAESHEDLLEELNGIALPRPSKPRKPSASKASQAESAASVAVVEESAGAEPEARQVELLDAQEELPAAEATASAASARKGKRGRAAPRDVDAHGAGSEASTSE